LGRQRIVSRHLAAVGWGDDLGGLPTCRTFFHEQSVVIFSQKRPPMSDPHFVTCRDPRDSVWQSTVEKVAKGLAQQHTPIGFAAATSAPNARVSATWRTGSQLLTPCFSNDTRRYLVNSRSLPWWPSRPRSLELVLDGWQWPLVDSNRPSVALPWP
jgi:hypothetical protein